MILIMGEEPTLRFLTETQAGAITGIPLFVPRFLAATPQTPSIVGMSSKTSREGMTFCA